MWTNLLIVFGTAVLSFALRSYQHPIIFRVGSIGLMATSFLAGWLLLGHVAWGVALLSTWFLLPWVELIRRIRKLTFPINREYQSAYPPTAEDFPELREFTSQLEETGFARWEDLTWTQNDQTHFLRFLYKPESKTLATISQVRQGHYAYSYVSLLNAETSGSRILTWNYPFGYGLKQPRNYTFNALSYRTSVPDLVEQHINILEITNSGFDAYESIDQTALQPFLGTELKNLIDHNLQCGLLQIAEENSVKYTFRGLFYLWTHFLNDLTRIR